ncbi:MAG: hypothetical protein RLZZ600_499 [Actinomycetota bacterium]
MTPRRWVLAVVVMLGVAAAFGTYLALNFAPGPDRWPAFYAWNPATQSLVNSDTGNSATETFVLKSWADDLVPFVPIMALPYLSYLLLVPIFTPILNLIAGSFKRFLTVGLALIVAQIFLDLSFWLFQTTVLRTASVPDGPMGALVHLVWGNDQPFNGYPSGHCAWTTIAIISLWRLRKRFPKTAWILMPWLALIYPATVMLQQHYLMDVYAGIFVGFASYWAVMFVVERPQLIPSNEAVLPMRHKK